jgi:hypothetical protein
MAALKGYFCGEGPDSTAFSDCGQETAIAPKKFVCFLFSAVAHVWNPA